MCRQCYGGCCPYCEGFTSEAEQSEVIEPPKRSMKEIKRLANTPDYEQLQLTKQSKLLS